MLLKKSQRANSGVCSCGCGECVSFFRVKMHCGLSLEATSLLLEFFGELERHTGVLSAMQDQHGRETLRVPFQAVKQPA